MVGSTRSGARVGRGLRGLRGLAGFGLLLATLVTPELARAHDVVPPKPLAQPSPSWPGDGPREDHDVVVPVVVVVGVDGRVTQAEIEVSVSAAFDAAALEAAKEWSFEPALRDGKPVAARVRSAVRFVGASRAPVVQAAPATPSPDAAAATQPSAPTPPTAANAASAPLAAPTPVATVRVTGTAPPRSASEVVRDREIIGAAPHRTASDALDVVPGVFVTQHSGEGKAHQIFLRGFDAVHGQDVELWVGGIPVNEVSNVHGQGYADLHFVMPEVIRDIQATPGTFDPRQGDFAVAGSMRMRLSYPEPGATIKGSLGSFGGRRLFLAYHPKEASEETFAAFESYSTDGFGPSRAARRGSLIAQATHDFAGGLALRVLGTTYAGRFDSPGVVTASDVESGRIDRFAVYDPRQGGASSRHQVLVELHEDGESARWSVAPFLTVRSLQLRQNFTGYFADTQRSGSARLGSDNTQQIDERITLGLTASYRKAVSWLSSRDSLELGVYGRHDVVEQSQRRLSEVDDSPTETLVDAAVRGTNVAGYVDVSVHPLPRLAVRGGVRADVLAFSAVDRAGGGAAGPGPARAAEGAHLGKKLTLDYALLPRTHALVSYGEGFRSPQARSLSAGERTFFTEVSSWEAGLRYRDGRTFEGSVAAFYTRLSEDLAFDPVTARNETVPGTARKGLAAELTARAGAHLLLSGSATYTHASFVGSDATYAAGDLLPYVPQLVVRSDVAVRGRLGHVLGRDLEGKLGGGVEGLAMRPLPFRDTGQNVFLLDAAASIRAREIEVGLDVFNLLDRPFYDGQFTYASNFARSETPSLVPARHVTAGPPRTVFATVTLYL